MLRIIFPGTADSVLFMAGDDESETVDNAFCRNGIISDTLSAIGALIPSVMCVNCIIMGIMLTYVTVKSGSVWPAVIMHAVNNAGTSILDLFTNTGKASGILKNSFYSYFLCLIPMAVTAGSCLVLLFRNKPSEQIQK